jgi:predicted metal-dependent HD superfamily phosphohydrolase
MFEEHYKAVLSGLKIDPAILDKCWKDIQIAYSNNNRYYHNLTHLDNLLTELLPIKECIHSWPVVILSIAYHDIVYSTLKSNNEEKSAAYALTCLTQLGVNTSIGEKCATQILATKGHAVSQDIDTNYFTDADLAILGAHSENYRYYATSIRKEYKFYPDFLYVPGRKKVLNHFLALPRIFKTNHFYEKYEEAARKNLEDELERLVV